MKHILYLIWAVFAIAWTIMFVNGKEKYEKPRWFAIAGMVVMCIAMHCS